MKLITRDTDYAIRALAYIACHKEKLVSVTELVEALHIPRPFLRKILQVLNRRKVLRSLRGVGGGFSLVRKPKEIFLTDIIGIFQGEFQLNECLFRKKLCPQVKTCFLRKKIVSIEKFVIAQLKSVTLASLLRKG
jgi:Rrf2 family protein